MPDYGLLGGIGEGLQSAFGAYQQQAQNARQQNQFNQELALKKRMADLQAQETAAKYYDLTGEMPKDFNPSPGQVQPVETPQQTPEQPQAGLIPEKPQGMVPIGLVKQQPQAQQDLSNVPLSQDYVGTKINPGSRRGRELIQQAMAHTATLYGKGARGVADLDTGQVRIIPAPMSQKEQLELKGKELENTNKQTEPKTKAANEFLNSEAVKKFDDVASNYGKMVALYNTKSSIGDKGLVYNFIRMENPGQAIREGSLEDIRELPGAAKYQEMLSLAATGRLPENVRSDILRAGTSLYLSQRSQHLDAIADAKERNGRLGIQVPDLDLSAYKKLDKKAKQYAASLGDFKQPGVGGVFSGLLGGTSSASDKVTVSKGNESYVIDRSDLGAAQKDGFQIVK